MSDYEPTMKIRVPQDLKEKIRASSKANNRSMNAEIVHRLEQTFNSDLVVGSNPDDELAILETIQTNINKYLLLNGVEPKNPKKE